MTRPSDRFIAEAYREACVEESSVTEWWKVAADIFYRAEELEAEAGGADRQTEEVMQIERRDNVPKPKPPLASGAEHHAAPLCCNGCCNGNCDGDPAMQKDARKWSLRMAAKEQGLYVGAGSHGISDTAKASSDEVVWQLIEEMCVITEAVTPDKNDVRGTINRLIDYYAFMPCHPDQPAYDRGLIAEMLWDYSGEHRESKIPKFTFSAILNQSKLLRLADTVDTFGVRTVLRPQTKMPEEFATVHAIQEKVCTSPEHEYIRCEKCAGRIPVGKVCGGDDCRLRRRQ